MLAVTMLINIKGHHISEVHHHCCCHHRHRHRHHGRHRRDFEEGVLCVGGQLTNMQPIRTRKLDNFVEDHDEDNDDDDDDDSGTFIQRI